jgi:tripartite-type tricarboxylate transporter receptor subunit TctC
MNGLLGFARNDGQLPTLSAAVHVGGARPSVVRRMAQAAISLYEGRMKVRSIVVAFAFAACAFALAASGVRAAWPDRIIKIVVPFAPGGGTDVVARTLALEMAKELGVSLIIENKPGAGTIIGTQAVAAGEGDGYTLLMGTFANAVNPSLYSKLPYDQHRDLAPVALVARSFSIVVVNPKSDIRSIKDLIATAKAAPDKLSYGTYGTGTSAHLAGELFKHMAQVNLTTVPYKGSAPAITDLIGGQIQVMFTTVASCASLVEGGQLRALAVTSSERSPAFPNLPTVAEAGVPGYDAEAWYGLFAPAKTPPEIIDRLNRAAATAVKAEAFKKLGVNEGLVMVEKPPGELERYFREEEDRWRKVIQDAGIKAE